MVVDIHNPDAKLLEDWMARQLRTREVMIRRKLLNWRVRKRPEMAALLVRRFDEQFRENARNYMKSAP